MTASTVPRELVDGATAIVRGALDAGCTFFAGYPITPASSILAVATKIANASAKIANASAKTRRKTASLLTSPC